MTLDPSLIDINELLYHEPPMVLLNSCTAASENSAECKVVINRESLFASEQGVPSYVAIEYMAQATAVFDGISRRARGKKPKIGFLLGTRRLELMCDFFVFGMELLVKAERIWDGESVTQYQCKISDLSSGGVLSSANLTVYSPSVQSEADND